MQRELFDLQTAVAAWHARVHEHTEALLDADRELRTALEARLATLTDPELQDAKAFNAAMIGQLKAVGFFLSWQARAVNDAISKRQALL